MIRKCISGLSALGAGIAMLIGIGVGEGIGIATGNAAFGVARNPLIAETIIEALVIANLITLIPFLAAFIIALCLVFIAKKRCYDHSILDRELAGFSAGIAVLGGIGAGLGIGTAAGVTLEGIARQPEFAETIFRTFVIGSSFALVAVVGAFIIARCLIKIAKGKHLKKKRYCDNFCDDCDEVHFCRD